MTNKLNLKTTADVYLYIKKEMSENSDYELDDKEFVVEEDGEWISDGKYETNSTVYYHPFTETYWMVSLMHRGDYWDGYEMDDEATDIAQVIPKEIRAISWVNVK